MARKHLYEYRKEGLVTYWRDAARSGVMLVSAHGGRAAGADICVEPAWGAFDELNAYDNLKLIAGAEAFAHDVGERGIRLVSDGAYWRPRDGRVLMTQRFGTYATATSLAFIQAATGTFTLPFVPRFPAGLIAPHTRVSVQADVLRTGANATATLAVRLGTAGTSSDSSLYQAQLAATDQLVSQVNQSARFGASATSFYTMLNTSQNANAANGADRTANVNTAAEMILSITITSASALDRFDLLGLTVALEG